MEKEKKRCRLFVYEEPDISYPVITHFRRV